MTTTEVVQRLAHLIEKISGNAIPDGHLPFLADIAARRAAACDRRDAAAYVDALAAGLLGDEWRESPAAHHGEGVVPLPHPAALRRDPRGALAATRRRASHDAAAAGLVGRVCQRGRARHARDHLGRVPTLASWGWRIDATDVDEEALAAGRRGLFGDRAVAQVPAELRDRYFVRQGEQHKLSRELLARIDYRAVNLIHEPFPVPAEPYDLILLRNVLIYFRPESQRRVISGMARPGT